MKIPFCTIIVLNYFGEDVIADNVNSLMELDYPKDRYEVIIVDNNSKDKSKRIISEFAQKYSQIKTVFLDKNLGFSKGNNVAMRMAQGEYVALLNNDCIVEKAWLKELIKIAESDKKIFAVNSKVLLYPGFLTVQLKPPPFLLVEDCAVIGSALSAREPYERITLRGEYKEGFYQVDVPFDTLKDQEIMLSITFNDKVKNTNQVKLKNIVSACYKVYRSKTHISDFVVLTKIKLKNALVQKQETSYIQNAGIIVFQSGYGRDVGALVRNQMQFYEPDSGQYDNPREVYAACAAAVLYRKEILDKIGLLDENFFMYYEDVDISERARIYGYKNYYSPTAVVRHYHSLTSKEWSPKFVYNAEKGRLLHLIFNFPLHVFIIEYIRILGSFLQAITNTAISMKKFKKILRVLIFKSSNDPEPLDPNRVINQIQLIKVFFYIGLNIPRLLFERRQKYAKVYKKRIRQNYELLLSGRWLFQ